MKLLPANKAGVVHALQSILVPDAQVCVQVHVGPVSHVLCTLMGGLCDGLRPVPFRALASSAAASEAEQANHFDTCSSIAAALLCLDGEAVLWRGGKKGPAALCSTPVQSVCLIPLLAGGLSLRASSQHKQKSLFQCKLEGELCIC